MYLFGSPTGLAARTSRGFSLGGFASPPFDGFAFVGGTLAAARAVGGPTSFRGFNIALNRLCFKRL